MAGQRISPGVFRSRRKSKAPVLIRDLYKSRLEDGIAKDLESRGVQFEYEKIKLTYTVPAKDHGYTADFNFKNGVIVEAKGWLTLEDRKKMVLVKQSNPELDIRIFFQRDPTKAKIYKGSPTTYAMWCEKNGFPWAFGTIPDEWLEDKPTAH